MKFMGPFLVLLAAASAGAQAESVEVSLKRCLMNSMAQGVDGLQDDDRVSDALIVCQGHQQALAAHWLGVLRNYNLQSYAHARTLVGVYATEVALATANAALKQ